MAAVTAAAIPAMVDPSRLRIRTTGRMVQATVQGMALGTVRRMVVQPVHRTQRDIQHHTALPAKGAGILSLNRA